MPLIQPPLEILRIFVSPAHNFFGHHDRPPDNHPALDVETVTCVPGRGIEGDRFFDYKSDYKGQVTFFSQEVYDSLCAQFQVHDRSPGVFRRNIYCAGVDLNSLIGEDFEVQGIAFRGREECRPCYWMDQAFAPGAEAALRGRGGLRAEILTPGALQASRPALVP